MANRLLKIGIVAAACLAMAGCASTNVKKHMAIGAGIGAAVGGLYGAAVHPGEIENVGEGILAGGVTGAAIGALVGDKEDNTFHQAESTRLDDQDKQIAALQEESRAAGAKAGSLSQQLATAQRRAEDLQGQVTNLQNELAGNRNMSREITLAADVLFNSGSDALTAAGRKALDDAAAQVKAAGDDKIVQVEGHTDTDPIKASPWKSNWELGSARSLAVLHYLLTKGVASEKISAATFSQYHPVEQGDTAAAKAKNRRAVIMIYSHWPVH